MASITQLRYLLAVEKHRHFGRAAKACFVSQPSLSIQIQKVEHEFGFLIFHRSRNPIFPTPKGELVLDDARIVLRAYNRMIERARYEKDKIQGIFRLALIPTILPTLVPYFLDSFCRAYPNVQLIIEERTTESCILALKEEKIDAAILATPTDESGIIEKVLYYEEFLFFGHLSHPLLQKKYIDARALSSDRLWLLRNGHCLRNQILSFCSVQDPISLYPNLIFEGNSLDTLRQLIRKGIGFTLFPQLYVASMPDSEIKNHVRAFQKPAPVREVSMVYKKGHWKTDIIDVLHRMILDVIPESVSHKVYGEVLNISVYSEDKGSS